MKKECFSTLFHSFSSFFFRSNKKRMSLCIETRSEIDNIIEINGNPVSFIDSLCFPLEDRHQDEKYWRRRSSAGFITKECESVLNVMKEDWICVEEILKTTHIELVRKLRQIISGERPEYIQVQHHRFNAPQWSPFGCFPMTVTFKDGKQTTSNKEIEISDHNWDDEYVLINKTIGLEIVVASGVIDFIECLGFYEGGNSNPYRVDPFMLACCLFCNPEQEKKEWIEVASSRAKQIGSALAESFRKETEMIVSQPGGKQEGRDQWEKEFRMFREKKEQEIQQHWNEISSRILSPVFQ